MIKCPGAASVRQPKPELFVCPYCGAEVEIWTDENERFCPGCQRMVYRNMKASCLDWCNYGKECIGEEAYGKYIKNKQKK